MIDTCRQLVGIVGTGLYHLMADVQSVVGRTVDPLLGLQLINFQSDDAMHRANNAMIMQTEQLGRIEALEEELCSSRAKMTELELKMTEQD